MSLFFSGLSKAEVTLADIGDKSVILNSEGGTLGPDAGSLHLQNAEDQIKLVHVMSIAISDKRNAAYVKHTLTDLLMQGIAQIVCGYEDANDCSGLRDDPVFKMPAGRYPEAGEALASQPAMYRFENRISRTALYPPAPVFADTLAASYDSSPSVIIIDSDDTEDMVHGDQQLSLFRGYYGNRCCMPLHVYEGLSGKLITAILKPGKRSNGRQMLSIVKRIAGYLHKQQPGHSCCIQGRQSFCVSGSHAIYRRS